MVEMLPSIEVVADDGFNSDPADPKNMGPDALLRYKAGESLPTASLPTPLVGSSNAKQGRGSAPQPCCGGLCAIPANAGRQ